MSEEESAILTAIHSLEQRLQEEISTVSKDIVTVTQTVDLLASATQSGPSRTEKSKASEHASTPHTLRSGLTESSHPRLWADTMPELEEEYANNLSFIDGNAHKDEEDREECDIMELSEDTLALVKNAWSKSLGNSHRREIQNKYPVPDTPHSKTPKLDEIFSSADSNFSKSAEAKQTDKELLQLQGYVQDVSRPLLALTEAASDKSSNLSEEDVKVAAADTLKLLGNAVYQISRLCRKRGLKSCNSDMANLADNSELFEEAAPQLFGAGFEKNIKERKGRGPKGAAQTPGAK